MKGFFASVFRSLPGLSLKQLLGLPLKVARLLFETRVVNRPSNGYPLFLTWSITFDCNVYCRFCSTHKLHHQFPPRLSRERSLELAHEIGRSDILAVGFTGGEVLLHSDLFDLVKVIKSYGKSVYLVTNGLLLEEYAAQIVEAEVDAVVVSVDSLIAEQHDNMRKSPGLLVQLMSGMRKLKDLRGEGAPKIKTTTVVSAANLKQLPDIIETLEELADTVALQPITNDGVNSPHSQSDEAMKAYKFPAEQQAEVAQHLKNLQAQYPQFDDAYTNGFLDFWFDKEALAERVPCWSPFLRLIILPDGETYHCQADPQFGSLGNIANHSLYELWNSPEMLRQREVIRNCENHCICWTQDTSFNALAQKYGVHHVFPPIKRRR